MRTALAQLVPLFILAGCQQPPSDEAPTVKTMSTDEFAKWRSEVIELPSQFAPGLPKGVEELRFAPGMYDANAEDYWSYCFVLRFENRVDAFVTGRPLTV